MKKIKFSIITPTYNRKDLLIKCIESVLGQELGKYDYEHIIIDDGSEDGTGDYIKSNYGSNNKKLRYFYQKNSGGPAKPIQKGLSVARGNYVTILSDDDTLPESSLKLRANYILENPDVDWFYSDFDYIDENDKKIPVKYPKPHYKDFLYERNLIANTIPGGTPVIKAEIIKKIVWPKWLKRSEDYFMWLELLRPENNYKVGYLKRKTYNYRWHPRMFTNKYQTAESYKEKEELDKKIKALHPKNLVFMANEAYKYKKEANEKSWRLIEFKENIVPTLESEINNLKAQLSKRACLRQRIKNFLAKIIIKKIKQLLRKVKI